MVDRAYPLSHQPQLEMIGIKQAPSPINTLPGVSSQIYIHKAYCLMRDIITKTVQVCRFTFHEVCWELQEVPNALDVHRDIKMYGVNAGNPILFTYKKRTLADS